MDSPWPAGASAPALPVPYSPAIVRETPATTMPVEWEQFRNGPGPRTALPLQSPPVPLIPKSKIRAGRDVRRTAPPTTARMPGAPADLPGCAVHRARPAYQTTTASPVRTSGPLSPFLFAG